MKKILSFLLPIALVAGFTACNKENPDEGGNGGTTQTPGDIEEIVITVSETTTTSLTFTWSAVEEAGSLKYNLTAKGSTETIGENTGALQGTATTATCTGLTPNTEYTFTLKAYKAANGTGNPVAAGTKDATTTALTKLATPEQVEAMTFQGFTSISWNAVENAASYTYTIKSGDQVKKTATIEEINAMVRYLPNGTYTLSVVANPAENSTEYSASDAGTSEAFPVTRDIQTTKTVDISITYYDATHYHPGETEEDDGWYDEVEAWCSEKATLEIYDDGTYLLKNFMGGNRDLAFTVTDEGTYILNAYSEADGYQHVSTGLASPNNVASFTEGYEDYLYCGIDYPGYGSYFGGVFYIGQASYGIDIVWDVPAGSSDDDENGEGGTTPGEEGDN